VRIELGFEGNTYCSCGVSRWRKALFPKNKVFLVCFLKISIFTELKMSPKKTIYVEAAESSICFPVRIYIR
jgi:hypothetical protein